MAFIVGLSGAMSPGPLTVAVLDQAARAGAFAGPAAALTHALLELLMVSALGMGLARLLRRSSLAALISFAGGAVLIWMSWRMISGAAEAVIPGPAGGPPAGLKGLGGPLIAGVAATLSNPYWFLWWVSVGAAQLAWTEQDGTSPLVFWGGHVLSDLACLTALSLAVATGRRFLGDAVYRGLLYILGGAMGVLGLWFVAGAPRLLRGQDPAAERPGDSPRPAPRGPSDGG